MSYSLIKKASARTIMGDVKKIAKELESGETLDLFTVIGVASGTKTGETDNGTWVAFTGRFEATNLLTGEAFRTGNLFLPDVASDLVEEALKGDVESLELGFLISIRESSNSVVGYEYNAKPLMQPTQDDPLDRLKGSMQSLPAPKVAEKAVEKVPAKTNDKKSTK